MENNSLKLLASAYSDCMAQCGRSGASNCAGQCSFAPGQDRITNPALGVSLAGKTGVQFLQSVIPKFITIALVIGVLIFFFTLVTGAIQWISSGGDKQGLEGARGKITNAIVGLVILFATFAIIKLIENFFGIKILTLDIGSLVI